MSIQKVHFGVTALLVSAILALLLLTACDSPVSPSGGESDDDVEDFGGLPSVEMVATAYMTMHHVVFPAIEGDLDWDNVAVFGSIDEETGGEIQIVVVDAVINEEDGSTVEADLSVQVDYGEIESSVAISGEATFTDFEYGIESLHFTDAMIYFTGDAVGQAAPNPPHHASGSFEIDGEAYEVTDLLHAALTAELTYTISYITTSVAFESYPDWWDDELPDGIAHSELEHDHHRVFFNSFATGDDTHAPVYNGHFDFTEYVRSIESVGGPFDLIVVDGRARLACLDHARNHLAPGGRIVFDDIGRERYRPALRTTGLQAQVCVGAKPSLPYRDATAIFTVADRNSSELNDGRS